MMPSAAARSGSTERLVGDLNLAGTLKWHLAAQERRAKDALRRERVADVDKSLQRLVEIDGVTAALYVGKDGLVVSSSLDGDQEELVGAMVAAAFDAAGRYVDQLGTGQVRYALFEAAQGTVHIAESGEVLLVVQAATSASIGRIRLELMQAAQRLAQGRGEW